MSNFRRALCTLLVGAGALASAAVSAQTYPTKPVRFIAPGTGATELVARIVAQGLTEKFGQQFFVDVRQGAGGNIGADTAAKSPADGYTLFLATQPHTVNTSLYKTLTYNFIRDFAPITRLTSSPLIVVVHPSLPVRSIGDLVALAKEKPGVLNYAHTGVGVSTYLAAEVFKSRAGVNITAVPYRGGGLAETGLLSGETPLYFGPAATLLQHIEANSLRAIAVTTAQRIPALPQVPSIAESGYPGFEYANWHGLVVPAGTPAQIQAALQEATVGILRQPDFAKKFADLGLTPVGNSAAEFTAFIKTETETWAKIIKEQGIEQIAE